MNIWPLICIQRNKFIERRKQGLVRYLKPLRNIYVRERKEEQINRRLCTSAYRK